MWTELRQEDRVSCFQFHQHRQRYHNLRIHSLFVANYYFIWGVRSECLLKTKDNFWHPLVCIHLWAYVPCKNSPATSQVSITHDQCHDSMCRYFVSLHAILLYIDILKMMMYRIFNHAVYFMTCKKIFDIKEAPYSFLKSRKCIILYIDILLEEWNKLSGMEQFFENQKMHRKSA